METGAHFFLPWDCKYFTQLLDCQEESLANSSQLQRLMPISSAPMSRVRSISLFISEVSLSCNTVCSQGAESLMSADLMRVEWTWFKASTLSSFVAKCPSPAHFPDHCRLRSFDSYFIQFLRGLSQRTYAFVPHWMIIKIGESLLWSR